MLKIDPTFSQELLSQDQCFEAEMMRTTRHVLLEGTINTRDFGGYATTSGRRLVRGRIFRSDNLAQISDRDLETLQGLEINQVFDFRGAEEVSRKPDRLPSRANYLNTPIIGSSVNDNTIAKLIEKYQLPEKMLDQALVGSYGPYYRMLYLVDSYGTDDYTLRLGGYKQFFQMLLTLPAHKNVLCHCTGGRDRTGVGIALLQKMLDVPDNLIAQEFTASNTYLQPDSENPDSVLFRSYSSSNIFLQPSTNKAFQEAASTLGSTPDHLRAAIELRQELLERMFSGIDRVYGSFEVFLQREMGIGTAERSLLKDLYTI